MFIYILLGLIVVLALYAVGVFNGLIQGKNRVGNAWSDIDVQLKRRYDLIPNLVETVKGYKNFEASVLENVTKARASAMNAQGSTEGRAQAENMLSGALKSLFAVVENYPDLKASENFRQLQEQLAGLENDIQSARRYYNAAVREFNTAIEVFPANLVANSLGFKKSDFFGAEEEERQNVKVAF